MIKILDHHRFWSVDPNKLKDDRGIQKTRSLFAETLDPSVRDNGHVPIYTLDNEDKTLPSGIQVVSAYLIYMASVDEAEAAIKLVGSFKHWRRLQQSEWFKHGSANEPRLHMFEGLTQWREDMRLRDQSVAKAQLLKAAESGNVTAQRTLFVGMDKKEKKVKSKSDSKHSELIEQLHSQIIPIRK